MQQHGDIPSRDEVKPDTVNQDHVPQEAKYKAQLVNEILENGGVAHIYMKHTDGEGEDRHLHQFNTHVFVDYGLIYWHADDEDHWATAKDITMVERHYED